MPLYPAPSGCRMAVEMHFTTPDMEHVNVFHFAKRDSTPMTEQNLVDLVADWRTHISPSYRALFYTDMTGITFKLETLTPEPRVGITDSGTLNGLRVIDGDLLPRFISCRIQWEVGYLSRRWRGKTYIGGLREQDQNNGEATGGYMTLISNFMGAMQIRYGTSGTHPTFVFAILSDPDGLLPSGAQGVGQVTPQLAGVIQGQAFSTLTSLRRRMK